MRKPSESPSLERPWVCLGWLTPPTESDPESDPELEVGASKLRFDNLFTHRYLTYLDFRLCKICLGIHWHMETCGSSLATLTEVTPKHKAAL